MLTLPIKQKNLLLLYATYVATDFAAGGLVNLTSGFSSTEALLHKIMMERYVTFLDKNRAFRILGEPEMKRLA